MGMNLFDMALVIIGCVDLYIMQTMFNADSGSATALLRMMRILKVLRALRIVRTMALFAEVRVLLKTMASCFRPLASSMAFLCLFMLISAIIMCEFLQKFIQDDSHELEFRLWTYKNYGTTSRAFYTMYEVTMSGCWPNYVRPLIDISWWYAIFFVCYVTWVVFALTRIITAIFLKSTMDMCASDEEMMAVESNNKRQKTLSKLSRLFQQADTSGDGTLQLRELEELMSNPQMQLWLSRVGLQTYEAKRLFHVLDRETDGGISVEDFLAGVTRLAGHTRAIDLSLLQYKLDYAEKDVRVVRDILEKAFPDVARASSKGSSMTKTRSRLMLT